MDVSRRRLLAGVGGLSAVTLAGCTGGSPGRTSTAVFVTNELDEETRVTLRMYRLPDGAAESGGTDAGTTDTETTTVDTTELEQVYRQRATLAPEEGFAVDGEAVPNADLRLRVVTTAGTEGTYDWERVDELSSIDVRIRESGTLFTELD
ncbi:hypothetical protein [Natronomonas amylolytica]|uniref:hypothetical protein n=1 Tax=Natronomonas amylolytica TaxID=3108498 RepID=UPI003008031E